MGASIAEWMWFVAAGALTALSLAALWLGLRWDTARGRHRCPRCWYDMAAHVQSGSLVCPECGRASHRVEGLRRTRRNRWMIMLGAGMALLAMAAAGAPTIQARGWQPYAPTTMLICFVPFMTGAKDRTQTELLVRLRDDEQADTFFLHQSDLRTGPLWRWQRSLLCDRCIAALDDGRDPAARSLALGLLMALRSEASPAVPRLRELLHDSSLRDRYAVVGVIAVIGPAAVICVPELVELISADRTDDMFYVGAAIEALGQFGPDARSAVPALVKILEAAPRREWFGNEHERVQAIRTLGLIGPDAKVAIPRLAALAESASAQERIAAVSALGSIDPRDPRVVAVIHAALRDSEVGLRSAAAEIVSRETELIAPAIDMLTGMLSESDTTRQVSGVRGLMTLKAAAAPATAELAKLLNDETPVVVRIHAASALAEIGPHAAIALPALEQAAGDRNLLFRHEVDRAIARIRVDKE